MATWCQRDNSTAPFTPEEENKLDFLYSEWTHPHFISINASVPRCSSVLLSLLPFSRETTVGSFHVFWDARKCP